MNSKTLLAVGALDGGRLSSRVRAILATKRGGSPGASRTRVGTGVLAVAALGVGLTLAPNWIAFAQAPGAPALPKTTVELSSVRLADRQTGCFMRPKISPAGRFDIECASVDYLVRFANGVEPYQITGGPYWVRSSLFTVGALFKSEGGIQPGTARAGVQEVLKERFGVRSHWENRSIPAYVLVQAKNGIRAPRAQADESSVYIGTGHAYGSMTMAALARGLAIQFSLKGVPVTDGTGLTGGYAVQLDWTPDSYRDLPAGTEAPPPPPPPPGMTIKGPPKAVKPIDPRGPSLEDALKSQLGLQLESRKALVPFLVIDDVHRPTEN